MGFFRWRSEVRVSIPQPCDQNWDQMDGTPQERFCQKCQHTVHDFSSLTLRDAARLIESSRGQGLCGRVARDAKGNVMFRPDPEAGRLSRIAGLSLIGIAGVAMAQNSEKSCELKLRVVDVSGASIPGAQVDTKDSGQATKVVMLQTNREGVFSGRIPAGGSELNVKAAGFSERQISVSCLKEEAMSVKAELTFIDLKMGFVVEAASEPPRLLQLLLGPKVKR